MGSPFEQQKDSSASKPDAAIAIESWRLLSEAFVDGALRGSDRSAANLPSLELTDKAADNRPSDKKVEVAAKIAQNHMLLLHLTSVDDNTRIAVHRTPDGRLEIVDYENDRLLRIPGQQPTESISAAQLRRELTAQLDGDLRKAVSEERLRPLGAKPDTAGSTIELLNSTRAVQKNIERVEALQQALVAEERRLATMRSPKEQLIIDPETGRRTTYREQLKEQISKELAAAAETAAKIDPRKLEGMLARAAKAEGGNDSPMYAYLKYIQDLRSKALSNHELFQAVGHLERHKDILQGRGWDSVEAFASRMSHEEKLNASESEIRQAIAAAKRAREVGGAGEAQAKQTEIAAHATLVWHMALTGRLDEARKHLQETFTREASHLKEADYLKLLDQYLANEIKYGKSGEIPADSPLHELGKATAHQEKADTAAAEAAFKRAITKADEVDETSVKAALQRVAQEKREMQNNPFIEDTIKRETAWKFMAESRSITRYEYANFLIEQGRYQEAKKLLMAVAKGDNDFVKSHPDILTKLDLCRRDGKKEEDFDNPQEHVQAFAEKARSGDEEGALKALQKAVDAAKKIDKALARTNKSLVEEALKTERDPAIRKELENMRTFYDYLEHAEQHAKIAMALFQQSQGRFGIAEEIFTTIRKEDPQFAARPELEIDKRIQECQDNQGWWPTFKGIAKDVISTIAGIAAGAITTFCLGFSGPAGVAAGIVAGMGAYAGMQKAFGEELGLETIICGGLNGLGGAFGNLARTSLVKCGERLVSKEVAEYALMAGVKKLAVNVGIDVGTGLATYSFTRLGSEGYKYLTGQHRTLGEFSSAYVTGVALDTGWSALLGRIPGFDNYATRATNYAFLGRLPTQLISRAFTVASPTQGLAQSWRDYFMKEYQQQEHRESLIKKGFTF